MSVETLTSALLRKLPEELQTFVEVSGACVLSVYKIFMARGPEAAEKYCLEIMPDVVGSLSEDDHRGDWNTAP